LKKLLILGGSGFIGSSIVDYGIRKKLIKHKINEIYVLSRKNKAIKKKYKHIKISYISKNILNLKKLPQIDYIIYCLKDKNIKKSKDYFNHFIKLLKTLIKKPKILFTSSGAVYGKNTKKIKNKESQKINIKSINKMDGYKKKYALEKIFIEKKFTELGLKDYKVSIARCYTFIGKNIIRYKYAISNLINDTLKKDMIKLKTSINVYRTYMHSDDLAKWLVIIVKNSNTRCPIYNVGSDKIINLRKLVKIISKLFDKKPLMKNVSSKKFDFYAPSITKAKKELNLKISINLNDSINSTIKSLNDKN
jgi:nucleoside-diphosphate-sugar epimerase